MRSSRPTPPGNVFLLGETVTVLIDVPSGVAARAWRATDAEGAEVAHGVLDAPAEGGAATVDLGALGVGYYRVEALGAAGTPVAWTSAAVLAPLRAPTPDDSPVCCDAAAAWFARNDPQRQETFARLAALTGIAGIRDRNAWAQAEAAEGVFAWPETYETSADAQHRAGLHVLQAMHGTPAWACAAAIDGKNAAHRFPRDLRAIHRYYADAAARFRGQVQAWEPWNEANLPRFGGHTIDEMCSLQKAAALGLRKGDPDVTVCWNVYAGAGSRLQSEGVGLNESWPYFDTYNIHAYIRPGSYERDFATTRAACAGRPIWLTECGIRLAPASGAPAHDLAPADERTQAAFVAISTAESLFAGVRRHYFFILGNFREGTWQFGALRHDQTPRPAYVALAASGRFLAGARCLGRLRSGVGTRVYAFRARPDGEERDVFVAWAKETTAWTPPASLAPRAVYDHLGRERAATTDGTVMLGPAPVYIVAERGAADALDIEPPPPCAPRREGDASPVVLQASLPAATTHLPSQSHLVEPDRPQEIPLFVYNFSGRPVRGTLRVESAPDGWRVELPAPDISLEPMDRKPVLLRVTVPAGGADAAFGGWIRLRGDFGAAGETVLSFRLAVDPARARPTGVERIEASADPHRWTRMHAPADAVGGVEPAENGGVRFDMSFGEKGGAGHFRLTPEGADRPGDAAEGLSMTIEVEGPCSEVTVQFVKENGASYATQIPLKNDSPASQRGLAGFRNADWSWWSEPDAEDGLHPAEIRHVVLSFASRTTGPLRITVREAAWVRG